MTQTKLFTEQERQQMVRLRRRIARYEQNMSETQNSNLAKWIEPDRKELSQLYTLKLANERYKCVVLDY